jgi:flagellin
MSLSILNNISALNAENSLSTTQVNLQNTLTQLSTGLRINSGADDAAGLSIANGMTANIAALTQSGQNATNTTGLLQTADGALSQVTSLLDRATTLATEASTDGLSSSQTAALNTEFTSILSSINSIGQDTTFNGANVFSSNAITPFLSDGTSGNNMLGGASMSVGTLATKGATGLGINAAAQSSLAMGTTQPTAASSLQIGNTTYTFQASTVPLVAQVTTPGTAGTTPAIAATVQIGSTVAATLANLAAAINGTDGTNVANSVASAAVNAAGTGITFTASTAGAGTAAVDGVAGTAGTGNNAVATASAGVGTMTSAGSTAGVLGGGASDANLNSPAEAQSALVAITSAITTVSQSRGNLGAEINQLTAASNVMTSQTTNLQSADNDIMNADIGKTVANMTQYNILQSTGMSALQQANQAQQAVLKLLQ